LTDDSEIARSRDQILNTVLKFATLESATQATVRAGLDSIFQTRNRIQQAFRTQADATFTITNPRAAQGGATYFNSLTMMEATDPGIAGEQRQVVILVFPGVFKVVPGFRTCMVKARVLCRDQM